MIDEFDLMAEAADRLGIPRAARPEIARVELAGVHTLLSALRWGVDEPEVVLLHGGGQNAHTWDNVAFRLRRPALAIDLPGHGHSSWYTEPQYLPSRLADDLARAIELAAPRAEAVVGMSMGGLSAIALAARRPELVRRLILVDVSPGSTPERSADITDFVARDVFESFDDLLEHTLAYRPNIGESSIRRSLQYNARELPDGRWMWRHDRRKPVGDRMSEMFADLPRYWDDVGAIACPTMVVLGATSPIVSPDDAARYRRLVPAIEIVTVPGAGHNVQGDAPDRLTELIDGFLSTPC